MLVCVGVISLGVLLPVVSPHDSASGEEVRRTACLVPAAAHTVPLKTKAIVFALSILLASTKGLKPCKGDLKLGPQTDMSLRSLNS